MKLSKSDFLNVLEFARVFCEENGYHYPIFSMQYELVDGTLEIEGYVHVQWTKFDPSNPKTFPPNGGFLGYFANEHGSDLQGVCYRGEEDTDEAFATRSIFPNLTHWSPLPNGPVEQGAQNETK